MPEEGGPGLRVQRSIEELTDAINRLGSKIEKHVCAMEDYRKETAELILEIRRFYTRRKK
jgi:hypothetical protein